MRGSQVRLLPEIPINASVAQRIPFRQSLIARHSSNKFGSALAHGDLEHPTSNGRGASWLRPFSLLLGIAQANLALRSELRRVESCRKYRQDKGFDRLLICMNVKAFVIMPPPRDVQVFALLW